MDAENSSSNPFLQSQMQCKRNLQCLKDKVEKIKMLQNRIKKIPTSSVDFENWLKRAENLTQTSTELNEKMEKHTSSWNRCIRWLQYKSIGTKAESLTNSAAKLLGEGELLLNTEAMVEEVGSVKELEMAWESRIETCDQMVKELTAESKTKVIIGVYGMAGVGKTMLMRQLAKKVKEDGSFDEVVMVAGTPPSNPSLSQAQHGKIKSWLEMGKKILVILDNIWKPITSLKDIGIRYPFDEEHGGPLAIIITSRNQDVLLKMDTKKNFLVEPLPEDKTFDFLKQIGIDGDNESYIQILRECGGLPLALVEVASRIDRSIQTSELPDSVYLSLNQSFLYLENDELRHTLLLCSLFGNNEISYEHMLKYVVGEKDSHALVDLKMEDARRRIEKNMNSLKRLSLLQDGKSNQFAIMHPIIFQFAKIVAFMNHMFVSSNINEKIGSKQLLHHLHKDEQRNLTHISLLSDAMDETQFGDFRKLRFMYVGANFDGKSSLLTKNLEGLRVFDHVGTPIFGSTVYGLKYIQTLCLKDSGDLEAEEIAKIANLKSLKILSFTGATVIRQLPCEIGNLTDLFMLELRCRLVQVIPPNVLSKLNQLQEFYITNFNDWAEFGTDHNISLPEVGLLPRASSLDIDLPSPCLRYLELTSNVS